MLISFFLAAQRFGGLDEVFELALREPLHAAVAQLFAAPQRRLVPFVRIAPGPGGGFAPAAVLLMLIFVREEPS